MRYAARIVLVLFAGVGPACMDGDSAPADAGPDDTGTCAGPFDDRFDGFDAARWSVKRWCGNGDCETVAWCDNQDPVFSAGSLSFLGDDECLDQVGSTTSIVEGAVRVRVTPQLASGGVNFDYARVALAADATSLGLTGGGGLILHDGTVAVTAPGVEVAIGAYEVGAPIELVLAIEDGTLFAGIADGERTEVVRMTNPARLFLGAANTLDGATFDDVTSTQPCAASD